MCVTGADAGQWDVPAVEPDVAGGQGVLRVRRRRGARTDRSGRFSNGLTWPEQLAGLLNVTHVDDYAYGSATTDNRIARGYSGYNSTLPVPDVREQVSRYLAHVDAHADGDALYIVSGGSNDAFFGLSAERNVTELAHDVVHALQRDVVRLQRHGARHVMVPTLSPMQSTPYALDYADAATRANTTHFTHRVNAALRTWVHDGTANVTLVDLAALEARILDHPTRYGVHNTRSACLVGTQKLERAAGVARHECADPDRYFFFDLYHPTAHVHGLLAHGAAQALGVASRA